MFSVCITSVLRMTTLNASSKSQDLTAGRLNSTIWTTIEANTGIICACLPMLKAPLAVFFPRLFPRGSYHADYPRGSTSGRQGLRSHRMSPPADYDQWGRLKEKKPMSLDGILNRTPASWEGKGSTSTDIESAFGMVSLRNPFFPVQISESRLRWKRPLLSVSTPLTKLGVRSEV